MSNCIARLRETTTPAVERLKGRYCYVYSGADSMGTGGGTCPHFYKWLGTGDTVSRTANKKLTKLCWPSRKRSPKRLILLVEPKKWRGTTKFLSRRFVPFPPLSRRTCAPLPTFKFVPVPLATYRAIANAYACQIIG